MKKSWLLYVFFGVFFYVLFLFIQMPASWFAWALNHYSSGRVQLDPIAGTLWHGKGRLVYQHPPSTPFEFGDTEWRINPLWLLVGSLQLNWQSQKPDTLINTTVRMSSGQLILLETNLVFPAQLSSSLIPAAKLLSPTGQVRLQTDRLAMDRNNGMSGGGDIQWQAAGSALSPVRPLGDYRLEVVGAGKIANLKLTTTRGALELSGQGQWQTTTGKIQFNGTVTPRDRVDDLESLLSLLGENQGGGKRLFTMNTQLPIDIF
jgi:general secretion pathway protein N